ncbi:serine hydroxymethyltransferase [Sulfodiicoccus acidiphilus]|uniref:Serine hydroxymethyltransferase n=1 Tax=Sulfodiicoccus acidiphilus TaxID=1670455 RepID=A0A348B3K3_9CREN|nr:serine hydroxymethyltransferase [Sulfodiicoccus acidiphilus]BBD72755.1 serine hydroxymethyltransferase [Sulfodiicoccus acidiphilus]GGT99567.1 serine hydroxymethyltransferase [Sulfodiicoccus acidiphilus]
MLPRELERVIQLTATHHRWRREESINLIASENVMSPLAEAVYGTDLMSRYAEGRPYKRYYQGTKYVDELEILTMDLMNRLTSSKYCDVRPISGTIANAAVFRVLAEPGEQAAIAPVQAGAHVSHTKFGTLGALGIRQVELPYDRERMNVDIEGARKVIEKVKPKFVVLGGSLYLFPHPAKEIAEAAHSVGARLVYDAAHVYGLIVGGVWSNPLEEGADFLTASTHKTFPGPQGGVLFTNDESLYKPVSHTIFPWFLSNHHLHRLPSTAVTALEMLEFGRQYAFQVTKNAKALASALVSMGFKVVGENQGYTMSHQVAVDVTSQGGGARCAKTLEEANIIVNKNLLPEDPPEKVSDPSGLRLGVQEMTRYGMREGDMEELASLFKELLIDRKDPAMVKSKVLELRKSFLSVKYTFDVKLPDTLTPLLNMT